MGLTRLTRPQVVAAWVMTTLPIEHESLAYWLLGELRLLPLADVFPMLCSMPRL